MAMSPRLALRSALLVAAFLLVVMLIPHAPQPVRERPSIDKLFRFGRTPEPWVDLENVPWTSHDGGEWAGESWLRGCGARLEAPHAEAPAE